MLSAVTHTHQGLSEQSPRKIFLVEVGRKAEELRMHQS